MLSRSIRYGNVSAHLARLWRIGLHHTEPMLAEELDKFEEFCPEFDDLESEAQSEKIRLWRGTHFREAMNSCGKCSGVKCTS